MKRKYLAKAGAFALAAALLLPSTGAYAETPTSSATTPTAPIENVNRPVDTDKVFMEDVDKDGKVVKTYSKSEVEQMQQHKQNNIIYNMNVYSFESTSFSSNRWIKGGYNFYRPKTVWVDAKYRTSGLSVAVYEGSTFMGETRIWGTFDGGMSIPIGHHLVAYENYYKLKLINYDGGTIYLNGGQVYYE